MSKALKIPLSARLGGRRRLAAGIFLTAFLLALALLGQIWTPYPANQMDASALSEAPSLLHLMGTDHFGRDVLSRIMKGMGMTYLVAAVTVAVGGSLGVLLGLWSGYHGGILDALLQRLQDMLLAFPSLLLSLILIAVMGPGTFQIMIALSILFIPSFARIARAETLRIKELPYIQNARVQYISPLRIQLLHILPNALPSLGSAALIGLNNAALAEAGMSYLGLGVQPPDPSLGRMLFESQTYLILTPWVAIFSGLMLFLMIFGFALIADGLGEEKSC